ncbi:MAG: GTPase ObgE [Patescibacteria group bacterium]
MLIDEVQIIVKAGNGGNGASSFKRNAQTAKGGPDGGNGGNGGNVYFQGINDITALSEFTYKKKITAEDGIKGAKQNLYGRNGKDSIVFLPIGTFVTDLNTNDSFEIINSQNKTLIVRGGKGGRGNNEFKSATNQTPYYAEKGTIGEEKKLLLVLKLIADIGIIGLPNSGKSSLLSVLTRAHPKIGDYPFTTLEPNLGVLEGIVLADIPGLIEGASGGKGLGIKFLKHIEKTKMLLHCIDCQSEDLKKDYEIIRKELIEYDNKLSEKTEIILLTKSDMLSKNQVDKKMSIAKKINKNVYPVSIYNDEELFSLKNLLINLK